MSECVFQAICGRLVVCVVLADAAAAAVAGGMGGREWEKDGMGSAWEKDGMGAPGRDRMNESEMGGRERVGGR